MTERIRFNPAEAAAAGETDARSLLEALRDVQAGDNPANLLNDALAEIIGLAVEHRIEECIARLQAFCRFAGLHFWMALKKADSQEGMRDSVKVLVQKQSEMIDFLRVPVSVEPAGTELESHLIDVAIATCCRVSEGRIIAAHPDDEDAIVALAELQLAVRALESKFAETEGGKV